MAYHPRANANFSFDTGAKAEAVETDHGAIMVSVSEGPISFMAFLKPETAAALHAALTSVVAPKLRLVTDADRLARALEIVPEASAGGVR